MYSVQVHFVYILYSLRVLLSEDIRNVILSSVCCSFAVPTYMANRYVELNPDPGSRSDRPEWCYVRYDHTYHPLRAFQFELQWMVTTIEIFHQLVSIADN